MRLQEGMRKEPGVSGELLPLRRLGAGAWDWATVGQQDLDWEEALKGEERESGGPARPLCVFPSFPHHV